MAINSKQNGDNGIINLYYSFNMNKILICYSDTQKESFCFSIVAISLKKEFAKDDIYSREVLTDFIPLVYCYTQRFSKVFR